MSGERREAMMGQKIFTCPGKLGNKNGRRCRDTLRKFRSMLQAFQQNIHCIISQQETWETACHLQQSIQFVVVFS